MSADRVNVLILDDSIYHRAHSKKVELLARRLSYVISTRLYPL